MTTSPTSPRPPRCSLPGGLPPQRGLSPLRASAVEHHACLCCASSWRVAAPAKAPPKASIEMKGSHTVAAGCSKVGHHAK